MRSSVRAILVSLMLLTVLAGLVYPLLILGLAQAFFPEQADGSLVRRDGRIIGSTLIGQQFDDARYFWGRPSATVPTPYNAAASSGTNLAPSNPQLAKDVAARCTALVKAHGNSAAPIPLDLVTASGSGLDPHVTVAAMLYKVDRAAHRVTGFWLSRTTPSQCSRRESRTRCLLIQQRHGSARDAFA